MKKQLLKQIEENLSALNEQDANGHIWWMKFQEMVQQLPDNDWIPVTERMPDEMKTKDDVKLEVSHHVLATDGQTTWVAFYSFYDKKWELAHGTPSPDMKGRIITHWMPLPPK